MDNTVQQLPERLFSHPSIRRHLREIAHQLRTHQLDRLETEVAELRSRVDQLEALVQPQIGGRNA